MARSGREPASARRRRQLGACVIVLAGAAALAFALTRGGATAPHAPARTHPGTPAASSSTVAARGAAVRSSPQSPGSVQASALRPAIGLRVLRLVDSSRPIAVSEGVTAPRTLVTYVRYPALARGGGSDVADAPLARRGAPYPLIVFGHGFAVTPGTYARLLRAWAGAGFVVAAPAFPLENAHAPGGPDEADLPNQPADMSFVISSLLAGSRKATGPLAGAIDPLEVAVAGQSDGGDTALAVAYDPAFRDARVRAAVILSGAEIPGHEGFGFQSSGPALLATQGTADTVNPPALTDAFFAPAPRPKFELLLPGAQHLPPYTSQQPQLSLVERVSADFLDAYLRHEPGALSRMRRDASAPAVAELLAYP